MRFAEALEVLKMGGSVKLPHWTGFWKREGDTVKMHCRDERILDIRETEDIFYTLDNQNAIFYPGNGIFPGFCYST